MTRNCPECGEEVSENDDFCGNCGKELENEDEEETDFDIKIGAKGVLAVVGIIALAAVFFNSSSPANPDENISPENIQQPSNNEEIVSHALTSEDVPEGFSGYGEVSENSSIAKRTYIALYLESESESGEVSLDRGYGGKDAKIEEFISNMGNESRAEIVANGKVKESYTQIDTSETGGKAWVGGDVNLSENQMTGGDTRVNMTLVMQKGRYVGWLDIRMTDYYTQDTQKVMEAALNKMRVRYEQGRLRQSLENYYPSDLPELRRE